MQDAEKLAVYGEARELAVAVYRLTAAFPPAERFGITQQMRRAAVSVGSNIAEGCGRQGARSMLPFLHYALGSANELAFQLELAVDLQLSQVADLKVLRGRLDRTRRMLIRLSAAVSRRA